MSENTRPMTTEELIEENRNLRTVMMAAAVEITEHWDAHCDDEGYGPANLLRRLENGYPAQYGYGAATVVQLEKQCDELKSQMQGLSNEINDFQNTIERQKREIDALKADNLDLRSDEALNEAEAEIAKLRGLVAGRTAEYLAAHITFDKGYEEGRLDAESKMAGLEAPPCSDHPDAPHGFNRNASHNAGRYVCDCEGWKP